MRTRFTTLLTATAVSLLLVSNVACEPAADLPTSVVLDGHGYGHGRGMGQWGAYGYAVDHSWTGSMILNRFYAGTQTGQLEADARRRVLLQGQTGKDLIVYNQLGLLRTSADGYRGSRTALRISRLDDSRFRVYSGSTCAGPWTQWASPITSKELRIKTAVGNDDPRAMLQLCLSTGTRYYRGDLILAHQPGTVQTVNHVTTENLVRSVIAQEVSPSWADAGGGKGLAAVRAQAVAARSYASAGDTRWGVIAQTCDSTSCQDYRGYGSRANGSSTVVKKEDPRTDRATTDTKGQVRTFTSNGRIASTEFSASTGGWTAGGVFPDRPDDGDDTTANPNHTWAVTLTSSLLESRFDSRQGTDVGDLEGIDVLARNGYGEWGGRVTSVRVRFTKVDVTLTGEQFRSTTGIKSSWFRVR